MPKPTPPRFLRWLAYRPFSHRRIEALYRWAAIRLHRRGE